MLRDKFVLQKASPAAVEALNNLVTFSPTVKSHQIYGKSRGTPVTPAEMSWAEANEARMRKLNARAVLFALIVLLIVYSVMGWWALT